MQNGNTSYSFYRFVKDGVNYSINTDDPVVLGNTLTDDYKTVKEIGLTNQDIIRGVSVYFEAFTNLEASLANERG